MIKKNCSVPQHLIVIPLTKECLTLVRNKDTLLARFKDKKDVCLTTLYEAGMCEKVWQVDKRIIMEKCNEGSNRNNFGGISKDAGYIFM